MIERKRGKHDEDWIIDWNSESGSESESESESEIKGGHFLYVYCTIGMIGSMD